MAGRNLDAPVLSSSAQIVLRLNGCFGTTRYPVAYRRAVMRSVRQSRTMGRARRLQTILDITPWGTRI
jgi:hypothetical protein